MKIDYIKVGYLKCNCYLIQKADKYLLIDPGDDLEAIEKFIKDKSIIGILVTHNHFDHIASIEDLINKYNYPVYDVYNLKEGLNKIGNFTFEMIKTPGHTLDSVSYYFKEDKVMFTGDFLFKGTIGRCDLLESNIAEMKKSLKKILKYNDDIIIYPGHGNISTLLEEKLHNPYLKDEDIS